MIEPAVVDLSFRLIKGFPRKIIPVKVELKGEPGHDFQVEAVVVDPPELTIQGPFESIERIDQLNLAPIDITGLVSDVSEVMTAPDPADDVQVVDVPSVRVRILLAPRTERRLFAKIPVRLTGKSIYSWLEGGTSRWMSSFRARRRCWTPPKLREAPWTSSST